MSTPPVSASRPKGFKSYGLAVALVLGALLLTLLVNPPRLASPIFLLAVILAAWVGGTGTGLLAAMLSTMALAFFFLPPIYSFAFDLHELPQLLAFFVAAVLVSWWSAERRRVEDALLQARDKLEARVGERTEALRRTEGELRAAIDTIPAMAWSTLPDGTADFFNRRWQEYTGLSLEQSLGWEWGATVHPDDAEQYFAKWRECIATGEPIEVEVRFRCAADGRYRWFVDRGVLLRDEQGNALKWYGLVTDIDDRKRAEDALRRQTLLLKTVTDNASSMLYIVDAAGLGTFVNPALERITGYRAEELIGQVVHDKIHHTRPDGRHYPVSECPLTGAVRTGKTVHGEDLFVRKDGTFFPVRYTASPVFHDGLALGTVIEVQDLTQSKAAEEELRDAQTALARVNRVTTLGVLAASIAHEVNQPLGAMVTSAASCSRWLTAQPPDFERAQRALERIGQDGKRASEVIDRIRTLVKRQPPRRDRVDINEAILEVIALTRDEVQRNEIWLQKSLTQGLPSVQGDRIQLQQVIVNLIVNAIEAMNAVMSHRRKLIVHSMMDGASAVRVEVRDSGLGVDPARGNDVFESLYTTKAEGLGMGLSISRSIVEAHGGRLWMEPNEPHGAAFVFSLPVEGIAR